MSKTVALACSCGAVKGQLDVVKGSFFHVHCLCCDCQGFAEHLQNKGEILDQHGASELFQTYPAFIKISAGQDNIACMQLQAKGLYRWHTTCCNMPLANTMSSAKVPFVGISVKLMQFANEQEKLETLGPVTMKAFGKYSIGEMPKDVHPRFPLSYMPKVLAFMLKGMFGKKHKPSPFFVGNKPIAKARVVSSL